MTPQIHGNYNELRELVTCLYEQIRKARAEARTSELAYYAAIGEITEMKRFMSLVITDPTQPDLTMLDHYHQWKANAENFERRYG